MFYFLVEELNDYYSRRDFGLALSSWLFFTAERVGDNCEELLVKWSSVLIYLRLFSPLTLMGMA